MTESRYKLHLGDCLEVMATMAAQSVHCVVTSPPYYGLRDYGHEGQIGLEETPEAYVANLVAVFREVRRVLRDDGVVWLNLGDSYAGAGAGGGGNRKGNEHGQHDAMVGSGVGGKVPNGLKPKDLIGIPWRVAFALQADGWYLRQDIIWHKPNPMPESVTDRCTKAHEYIFLLSKSARYYYDHEAVKEPAVRVGDVQTFGGAKARNGEIMPNDPRYRNGSEQWGRVHEQGSTRNRRSVWTVSTKPYKEAHFATYPPELITPCILAGCPEQACPKCGQGWERVVEKTNAPKTKPSGKGWLSSEFRGNGDAAARGLQHDTHSTTLGFRPSCDCGEADSVAGVTLDPFNGSGTTGEVAVSHGRRYVGIELNPEYLQLAHDRVGKAELRWLNKQDYFMITNDEKKAGKRSLFDWAQDGGA